MHTKFDWQTDEEEVKAPSTKRDKRWYWPWRWLVVLVLLGTAVYGGIRWRAARQTVAITNDVLSSHDLVQTAVATHDVEMLNLVLSGRELAWQEAEQQLLTEGNFLNRPTFDLQGAGSPTPPIVTLSPDLQEAVVVAEQLYESGTGEQVMLQQTAVYRQGARSWLLAPPLDSFWGATVVTTTNYFTLTYLQRDAELVMALSQDLETLVEGIVCTDTAVCPTHPFLSLQFSSNPDTLSTTADYVFRPPAAKSMLLPTPILVGLPSDEAGYKFLERGYGAQLVPSLMAQKLAEACCPDSLVLAALFAKQNSQLGLRAWPLTADSYRQLLNTGFAGETWPALLDALVADHDQRAAALALVDFLSAETGADAVALQQELLRPGTAVPTLSALLSQPDFVARWLAFIYQQADYQRPSTLPTPPDLVAACSGAQGATLYRYEADTAVWSATVTVPALGTETEIWPLPDDDGYLAYQEIRSQFEIEARMTLHYEDEDAILLRLVEPMFRPVPQYTFTGETDQSGRYLLLFDPGPSRYHLRYFLVDYTNCAQGLCPIQVLFGRPVWSPAGAQLLLAERPSADEGADAQTQLQQLAIVRGDSAGHDLTAVGRGFNPQWLDDAHYLYLRLDDGGIPEIVRASMSDDQPQTWLTAADLLATLPVEKRPSTLTMTEINVHTPEQWAVVATADITDTIMYDVFLRNSENKTPTLLYQSSSSVNVSFAPNGRWLTLAAADGTVTLFDTTTDSQQTLYSPSLAPQWTADGRWLLTGHGDYLLLTAPDDGYQEYVYNASPTCQQISWDD